MNAWIKGIFNRVKAALFPFILRNYMVLILSLVFFMPQNALAGQENSAEWGHYFILTNGDELAGEFGEGSLFLDTIMGDVGIDLSYIKTIQSGEEPGQLMVTLENSDEIKGRSITREINILTSLGSLELPLSSIHSVVLAGSNGNGGVEEGNVPFEDRGDNEKFSVTGASGVTEANVGSIGTGTFDLPDGREPAPEDLEEGEEAYITLNNIKGYVNGKWHGESVLFDTGQGVEAIRTRDIRHIYREDDGLFKIYFVDDRPTLKGTINLETLEIYYSLGLMEIKTRYIEEIEFWVPRFLAARGQRTGTSIAQDGSVEFSEMDNGSIREKNGIVQEVKEVRPGSMQTGEIPPTGGFPESINKMQNKAGSTLDEFLLQAPGWDTGRPVQTRIQEVAQQSGATAPDPEIIIPALFDPEKSVRMVALNNIGKIRNEMASIAVMRSLEKWVDDAVYREFTIGLLPGMETWGSDILVRLSKHEDRRLRISTAGALSAVQDYAAIEALFNLLVDPEKAVSDKAQSSLTLVAQNRVTGLIGALSSSSRQVRLGAARAIIEGVASPEGPVIIIKASMDLNPEARREILNLIDANDPAVIMQMSDLLLSDGDRTSEIVIPVLGRSELAQANGVLLTVLKDEKYSKRVRKAAAGAWLTRASRLLGSGNTLNGDLEEGLRTILWWAKAEPKTYGYMAQGGLSDQAAEILINIGGEKGLAIACEYYIQEGDGKLRVKIIKRKITITPTILATIDEGLESDDGWVRERAVNLMTGLQGKAVFERLSLALKDREPNVRRCAAIQLARSDGGEGIRAILEMAGKDPNWMTGIRADDVSAAVESLTGWADVDLSVIQTFLGDPTHLVSAGAMRVLASNVKQDPAPFETVLIDRSAPEAIRVEAAKALNYLYGYWKLPNRTPSPYFDSLVDFVRSESFSQLLIDAPPQLILEAAVLRSKVLGRDTGVDLESLFEDVESEYLPEMIRSLGRMESADAGSLLISLAQDSNRPLELRVMALQSIKNSHVRWGKLERPGWEILFRDEEELYLAAVKNCGSLFYREDRIEFLFETALDVDGLTPEIRKEAAEQILRSQDYGGMAWDSRSLLLLEDPDATIRAGAVHLIGSIGHLYNIRMGLQDSAENNLAEDNPLHIIRSTLIRIFLDNFEEPSVRSTAAEAYIRTHLTAGGNAIDREFVQIDPWEMPIDHPDPGLRRETVRLISFAPREKALLPLLHAMRDKNEEIAEYALNSLVRVLKGNNTILVKEGQSIQTALDLVAASRNGKKNGPFEELLARSAPDVVEQVIEHFRTGKNRAVRKTCLRLLSELPDETSVQILLEALGDHDGEITSYAVSSLAGMVDREKITKEVIISKAAEMMGSGNSLLRKNLVMFLGKTGSELSVPLLLQAIGDPEYSVRRASYDSLAQISGERFGPAPEEWKKWWDGKQGE